MKETNIYNFKYKYIKVKRIYLKVTPCILVLKLAKKKKTSAKKSHGECIPMCTIAEKKEKELRP